MFNIMFSVNLQRNFLTERFTEIVRHEKVNSQ